MTNDDLRKHLDSRGGDDASLARELEADPALRAALGRAAGLEDFETHLRPLAEAAAPLSAEVAELVERLATRPPQPLESAAAAAAEEPAALGNYTGLTLIGRGGMGAVYRAFDERLRRVVALKMLSPALAASPEGRARFQREARAAAALSHPHILPIHAIETIDGRDMLVMPLNDGENLHTLVRRDGPLPPGEVARLGADVADGLAAAHAAGIIHRDIKPANLLLSADRREIRIADFGLAHIADDPAHTQPAIVAGTPHFLSPEQATGRPADARSDLFSLGATLYFLATGQLPFPGEQTTGVLHAVAHEPHRAARRACARLPAWLSALLDALLEKNPARRPATAAEVAVALRRQSSRWSRRRRLRVVAHFALAVLLGALAAFVFTRARTAHRARLAFAEAHPFHLRGAVDARFATLAEVLAAARDGDLVLLEKAGAYRLAAQHFGSRSLTLRAPAQVAVTIRAEERERVLFTTAGRLRLENLAIEHPAGFSTVTPLLVAEAGAEIIVNHCRLAAAHPVRRGGTFAENNAPLFHIGAGGKIILEQTLVVAHRRALAQFVAAPAGSMAELRVSASAAAVNSLLRHESRDAAGSVALERSSIGFGALLSLERGTAPVRFRSDRCYLDGMRALVFAPGLDAAEVLRVLAWAGDDNVFYCEGAPLNFLPASSDRTAAVPAARPLLEDWRALFPGTEMRSSETNSTLRPRLARNRTNVDPITSDDFTLPDSRQNVGADLREVGPR